MKIGNNGKMAIIIAINTQPKFLRISITWNKIYIQITLKCLMIQKKTCCKQEDGTSILKLIIIIKQQYF